MVRFHYNINDFKLFEQARIGILALVIDDIFTMHIKGGGSWIVLSRYSKNFRL